MPQYPQIRIIISLQYRKITALPQVLLMMLLRITIQPYFFAYSPLVICLGIVNREHFPDWLAAWPLHHMTGSKREIVGVY